MLHYTALWRHRDLLRSLTVRDLRARFIGSAAGLAWAVIQPLLLILGYLFLFDVVFGIRLPPEVTGTERFSHFLIVGILPWFLFADGVGRGAASLVDNGSLLQKSALPLILFPARAVFASALAFSPIVLLAAVALHSAAATLPLLLPWLLLQVLMMMGLALTFAVLTAALRDVGQMLGVILSAGMIFAPIFYPLSQVPAAFQTFLWLNPMTPFILGYQSMVLLGTPPPLAVVAGACAWTALALLAGALLLRRAQEDLVDWL